MAASRVGPVTHVVRLVLHAVQELAVGSLFCLAFLPFGSIRRGFFRTCVLILVGAVGLGVWASPAPLSAVFLLSLLLFGGSLWILDDRWPRLLLVLSMVTGAAGLFIPSFMTGLEPLLSSRTAPQMVNTLASSLLLGSALIGMLLGHYYLRDPDLPLAPIRRLANLFLLATVLQGLLLVVNLGLLHLYGGAEAATRIALLSTSYGPVFLGHLLIGIVGSFILACLIWDSVRGANVQAATGFFYVAILTVMIGEFLEGYLRHSTSIRF